MKHQDITVAIDLGRGDATQTVYTCDFSYDYVKIKRNTGVKNRRVESTPDDDCMNSPDSSTRPLLERIAAALERIAPPPREAFRLPAPRCGTLAGVGCIEVSRGGTACITWTLTGWWASLHNTRRLIAIQSNLSAANQQCATDGLARHRQNSLVWPCCRALRQTGDRA